MLVCKGRHGRYYYSVHDPTLLTLPPLNTRDYLSYSLLDYIVVDTGGARASQPLVIVAKDKPRRAENVFQSLTGDVSVPRTQAYKERRGRCCYAVHDPTTSFRPPPNEFVQNRPQNQGWRILLFTRLRVKPNGGSRGGVRASTPPPLSWQKL